jgi:transcriptional regulator with PAS, ATPase and Fis domain
MPPCRKISVPVRGSVSAGIKNIFKEISMIDSLKTKLWDLLKEKDVSLAMLYNKKGEILWHRGRNIKGKTIENGEGFSKSYIKRSLTGNVGIEMENVTVASSNINFPQSAYLLNVKALIIQPVGNGFFLYIDSGTKKSFTAADKEVFKTIGQLLGMVIDSIRKSETGIGGISGKSDEIENIRELVLKYSLEEEPILLLGETGVGKSHIARLIHQYSGKKGEFITIHTPSVPGNLFESEIFGHKKGAFTDARSDKKGSVDEAQGGTLFFDEISEVPVSFQAKFLRFIELKKYMILGDPVEKEANTRIIAATNRNLAEAINSGKFREDLYYRLQVLEINIPPLRERREDLKALVLENQKYLKGKETGSGFWEVILNYNWPGNVRELITVLTRAGILLDSPITGKALRDIIHYGHSKKAAVVPAKKDKIQQILQEIESGKDFWEVVRKPFLNHDLNRNEVKGLITEVLERQSGKYKNILAPLNIKEEDYKKFLNFINDNDLKP